MSKELKNKEKNTNTKGKSSFAKDTKAELKKVIWPNSKQLFNNTIAVITIIIIIGVIVFALDLCFEKLNSYGIDKLKSAVRSNESVGTEEVVDTDDSGLESNPVEFTTGGSEESEEGEAEETAEETTEEQE